MWRLQYNNVVQLPHASRDRNREKTGAVLYSVCNGVRLSVPISRNDNLQAQRCRDGDSSPNALPTEWCGAEATISLSQLQIFTDCTKHTMHRLYKTHMHARSTDLPHQQKASTPSWEEKGRRKQNMAEALKRARLCHNMTQQSVRIAKRGEARGEKKKGGGGGCKKSDEKVGWRSCGVCTNYSRDAVQKREEEAIEAELHLRHSSTN